MQKSVFLDKTLGKTAISSKSKKKKISENLFSSIFEKMKKSTDKTLTDTVRKNTKEVLKKEIKLKNPYYYSKKTEKKEIHQPEYLFLELKEYKNLSQKISSVEKTQLTNKKDIQGKKKNTEKYPDIPQKADFIARDSQVQITKKENIHKIETEQDILKLKISKNKSTKIKNFRNYKETFYKLEFTNKQEKLHTYPSQDFTSVETYQIKALHNQRPGLKVQKNIKDIQSLIVQIEKGQHRAEEEKNVEWKKLKLEKGIHQSKQKITRPINLEHLNYSTNNPPKKAEDKSVGERVYKQSITHFERVTPLRREIAANIGKTVKQTEEKIKFSNKKLDTNQEIPLQIDSVNSNLPKAEFFPLSEEKTINFHRKQKKVENVEIKINKENTNFEGQKPERRNEIRLNADSLQPRYSEAIKKEFAGISKLNLIPTKRPLHLNLKTESHIPLPKSPDSIVILNPFNNVSLKENDSDSKSGDSFYTYVSKGKSSKNVFIQKTEMKIEKTNEKRELIGHIRQNYVVENQEIAENLNFSEVQSEDKSVKNIYKQPDRLSIHTDSILINIEHSNGESNSEGFLNDSYSQGKEESFYNNQEKFEGIQPKRDFVITMNHQDLAIKTVYKNNYIKVLINSDFNIKDPNSLIKDIETILQENGFKRFNVVLKEKTKKSYSTKTNIERVVDVRV